jgi:hypothetical protein
MAEDVRAAAVEIVLAEERARGHAAEALPGTHLEKVHGCDILSRVPGEDELCRIEVKGWGTPLIAARGGFHWPLELEVSQWDAARSGVPFRAEIVANLRAYLDRAEPYERLTVDGGFIAENAIPNGYSVVLDPLRGARRFPEHRVLLSSRLRVDDVPRADTDWDAIGEFAITFPAWTELNWDGDGLTEAVERVRAQWAASGELPPDLYTLRLCLLREQRELRHLQTGPGGEFEDGSDELPYAQALIGAIRNCLVVSPGATLGP